jgi:hypothetical protein
MFPPRCRLRRRRARLAAELQVRQAKKGASSATHIDAAAPLYPIVGLHPIACSAGQLAKSEPITKVFATDEIRWLLYCSRTCRALCIPPTSLAGCCAWCFSTACVCRCSALTGHSNLPCRKRCWPRAATLQLQRAMTSFEQQAPTAALAHCCASSMPSRPPSVMR